MKNWVLGSSRWPLYRWILSVLFFSILLSGCTSLYDPESSQEFNTDQVGVVNSTEKIGQSITSRHSRISGITLWFSRTTTDNLDSPERLTISIYENPTSQEPIFSTNISTRSIRHYTPLQISFSPITLSHTSTFFIELSSPEEIIVHGRLEDCYPGGRAYDNRQPLDADIAFRLAYLYDRGEFRGDIQTIRSQINLFIPLLILLLLPGYAIVRMFQLNKIYTNTIQLAFSVGFSMATIPLLYLYASSIGINITKQFIQFFLFLCLSIIIATWFVNRSYKNWIKFIREPRILIQNILDRKTFSDFIHLIILISILLLAMFVRFIMIRDLATPAWVDSVHHGLITRLILESGSLPDTYLPYLDIETTLYHPGFHSSLAAFIDLSGTDINQGMLLFGQVLNAAMALSVYLLTTSLTRKPVAGLFAALITSTFIAMPAYYTSWGRYPQLTGLIILPIPFVLVSTVKNRSIDQKNTSLIFSAAIATAGLLLVHYRVALFLVCLLISWFITELISSRLHVKWYTKFLFHRVTPYLLLTCTLAFLWLIPVIRDTVIPRINPITTEASYTFFSDFSWHYLTPIFGKQVIALAILGAIWGLINRQKVAAVIAGWVVLLFLIANLSALNLPGGFFVNNSSVTIMLFMPLSIMAGGLTEQLITFWINLTTGAVRKIISIVFVIFAIYVSISGAQQMISILNPATLLSRMEDLSAIKWIDDNIPDDNIIMINPFSWGYGLYAGNDGGAWITSLAGNQTMPPPVLYGLGSEIKKSNINQISQEVIRIGASPDELWKLLVANNIYYIYIGERGGIISPAALATNLHYELLYHHDNTWLFHIIP